MMKCRNSRRSLPQTHVVGFGPNSDTDLPGSMALFPEHRADSSLDAVLVCQMCVPDPNGLLGNSVRQRQDGYGELPDLFPPAWPFIFLGTLPAHRPAHNIAKLAIRWPGPADAGSVTLCGTAPVFR